MSTFTFPQFPDNPILVSLFSEVSKDTLDAVKNQLVAANRDYDYCFLNTNHILSTEHLYHGVYKALLNFHNESMRAKTLNSEIIFNLSPINNILDAFRRFGVDPECSNVIVIKIFLGEDKKNAQETLDHWQSLLGVSGSTVDDTVLESLVDIQKVKKVYKLNDAKLEAGNIQQLTRLAIAGCVIRGM